MEIRELTLKLSAVIKCAAAPSKLCLLFQLSFLVKHRGEIFLGFLGVYNKHNNNMKPNKAKFKHSLGLQSLIYSIVHANHKENNVCNIVGLQNVINVQEVSGISPYISDKISTLKRHLCLKDAKIDILDYQWMK